MKSGWITLLTLIVCGISEVRTEGAEHCQINCACCASAPGGDRSLSTICPSWNNNRCKYGCKDGYYGGKCFNLCPEYCTRCAREFGATTNKDYKKCYVCADGYYNGRGVTDCSTPCPVNCADNQCDKTTGHCLSGCTSNTLTGNQCDSCVSGYYGRQCEPCPVYCKNGICDVIDGSCTDGCKDSRFTGAQCDQCVTGKYGDNCDKSCPDNCLGDVCDRTEGTCTHGCTGNFTGSKCEDCKPTYYGGNCENICTNCLNGQCDRNTGICDDCSNGYYSQYCNTTCSSGCKNGACHRYNATCTQGCWSGYSGDKCCVTNNNCEICDTVSTCSRCKTGFYGNSCGQKCPGQCNGCDKQSGNCTSCETGLHGNKCTKACPTNCLGSECTQQTGQCMSCKIGYHGDSCNEKCSDNCVGKKCDQDGGQCDYCIVGFHGPLCDLDCAQGCINDTCIQDNGVCVYGCDNGNSDWSSCTQAIVGPTTPSSPVGAAVGGTVGGLVVLVLVLLGIWFFYRRRSQQNSREPYSPSTSKQEADKSIYENAHVKDDEAKNEHKRNREKKTPSNKAEFHDIPDVTTGEPEEEENTDYYQFSNRINIVDLYHYVSNKAREYFSDEFQKLPKSLTQPCTFAKKSENISKNRYNGIYPYDHSRVTIAEDKSFFINACYINGYRKERAYIASLGPTEATTDNYASFWRMVWHEKSDVIVMLTNLHEATGMKCEKYWPELGKSLTFPRLELKCDSVEEYSEYTVRTFTFTKNKDRRTVNQLHFTAWPDKGVPDNVTSMIEFRQRVKSTSTLSQGPIIVHCSAGVGRTGTYIAIDLLTEEGETEGSVDVFDCVRNLREQRVNMVQTTDQYIYVHRAIVHTLTFDIDNIPAETFNEYVLSMSEAVYSSMFKKLETIIEQENSEERTSVSTNASFTNKNRPGSDIPGDHNRPRLYLNRSFNESSYINAMYANSFKTRNQFILAQTPLPTTVADFICLVYQDNCCCIVSIEDLDDHREDVGAYIPADNQTLTYGSFVVSSTKCQHKYNHQLRKLKIENTGKQSSGERTIHHYQYTNWKAGEKTPSDVAEFAQFVQEVSLKCAKPDEEISPILIHCLTGGEKSGLFCAVSVLLEKADLLRQISVANTLRQLRLRRPNVVCNKEQLKFLHECIAAQMEKFSTYTNVGM